MNSELSALAKKTYTYEKKEGEMMIDLDVKLTTTNLFIFLYSYLLTASFFSFMNNTLKKWSKFWNSTWVISPTKLKSEKSLYEQKIYATFKNEICIIRPPIKKRETND